MKPKCIRCGDIVRADNNKFCSKFCFNKHRNENQRRYKKLTDKQKAAYREWMADFNYFSSNFISRYKDEKY